MDRLYDHRGLLPLSVPSNVGAASVLGAVRVYRIGMMGGAILSVPPPSKGEGEEQRLPSRPDVHPLCI